MIFTIVTVAITHTDQMRPTAMALSSHTSKTEAVKALEAYKAEWLLGGLKLEARIDEYMRFSSESLIMRVHILASELK